MKKVKSNNDLFVSYVNNVLEISVDYKVVYSKYRPFTDEGIWVDAAGFDKKIRREVKNIMVGAESTLDTEEKVEEEVKVVEEQVTEPEVIATEKEEPVDSATEEVDAIDKEGYEDDDKEVKDFFENIYSYKNGNTKDRPTTKLPKKGN